MNHAYEPDPLSLEGDCRICGLNIPHPEPAGCSRQERWEHGVHGSAGTALTRRRHVDLCRLVTGQGC